MSNDLKSLFGKDWKTKPDLKLDSTQKSNFSLIVNEARRRGIKSDFAIAGMLAIVSKESRFKATTENSYRNTKGSRIRTVFGKRITPYSDSQIESISKDDIKFFDVVYGIIANQNVGYNALGNDQSGDGFRYRGRGFNQLTFKNIYKSRGDGIGKDLVTNPELLENPEIASAVLVEYYINSFKSISNEVVSRSSVTKFGTPVATINSINDIETAVDLFYLATAGSMVLSNYNKKIQKFKTPVVKLGDDTLSFPNDSLGGYTKARNRAPIFYQIITGNKLPDILPQSNVENNQPSNNFVETNDDVINQEESTFSNIESGDTSRDDFSPIGISQIFSPTIKPIPIILDASTKSKKQRKDFLTGLGTVPFIYYNGIQIEHKDIIYFELYHEGMLPAIKITFTDRNGIFRDSGFPLDDTIISILLYSEAKRLRSINMDFKVSVFKDMDNLQYSISGIIDVPEIYLNVYKSYNNKTSYESLQSVAKDSGLGFCTNISNSDDRMTWINPGYPTYKFVENLVQSSYVSEDSFMDCYIDFYYNLCFIDIQKEIERDNSNDKMVTTVGKNDFLRGETNSDEISSLLLSTDDSVKATNGYISKFNVTNNSTKVSINNSYKTRVKYYDTNNKELLIFDLDTMTSKVNQSIILKGKPGDREFFEKNVGNVWMGKLDREGGGGNSHINYNYSKILNSKNLDEMSKIVIDTYLPNPNFNLYKYQKVYLAILKEKPGLNHTSLRYKRLTGNWISRDISYIWSGDFYQKITFIRRDLEMDEFEKEDEESLFGISGGGENFVDNDNPLSPLDESPESIQTLSNQLQSSPVQPINRTGLSLEYVVDHSVKDNSGVIRKLIVIDGQAVDEEVGIAFIQMRDDAKRDGINLRITSGFRPAFGKNFKGRTSTGKEISLTTQETIRRDRSRWVMSERAKFTTDEDFIFNAKSSAYNPATAPPGKSNHGSGIAIDINTGSRISFSKKLNNKVYVWLIRNSWRYGFIRTVRSEEWHFEWRPKISNRGPYAQISGSDSNLFYTDLGLDKLNLA
jgi:predicted chitinase/LAS superfamily LD-carboxypeptidase LdcB